MAVLQSPTEVRIVVEYVPAGIIVLCGSCKKPIVWGEFAVCLAMNHEHYLLGLRREICCEESSPLLFQDQASASQAAAEAFQILQQDRSFTNLALLKRLEFPNSPATAQ